jgi:hypothetical protein
LLSHPKDVKNQDLLMHGCDITSDGMDYSTALSRVPLSSMSDSQPRHEKFYALTNMWGAALVAHTNALLQYETAMESDIVQCIQTAIPGTPRVVALAVVRYVTNEQVHNKTGEDSFVDRKLSGESTELSTGEELSSVAEKIVLSYPDFLTVAEARVRQQDLMASAKSAVFRITAEFLQKNPSQYDGKAPPPPASYVEPAAVACCIFCCLIRCFIGGDFGGFD